MEKVKKKKDSMMVVRTDIIVTVLKIYVRIYIKEIIGGTVILTGELKNKIDNLLPLTLQAKPV